MFEAQCDRIHHNICRTCKSVSLKMEVKVKNGEYVCVQCLRSQQTMFVNPSWIDSHGQEQFQLPLQLSCLRESEKLLIQRIAVYVPLYHLQYGQIATKGHVCSYEQNVQDVCNILPRLPCDVVFVKFVRTYKSALGTCSKLFTVRRKVVLQALTWLKAHNKEYHDIVINESNLAWMGDLDEMDLPVHGRSKAKIIRIDDCNDIDHQPGPTTAYHNNPSTPDTQVYGMVTQEFTDLPTDRQQHITDTLKTACKQSPTCQLFPYPTINTQPCTEYGTRLFANAFPWLFPGGRGDFSDATGNKPKFHMWVRQMLRYQDGRFAKDKMWCFYALNIHTRRENNNNGSFFVDGFYKEGKKDLGEIQDNILKGNNVWLDRLQYWSNTVTGSPAYWRARKKEVQSWAAHHIEKGHGPPSYFITLSCAEYHWPDIHRLIKERMQYAGVSTLNFDKHVTKHVNDYAIVVQEYFQERVSIWLNTVGKHIFAIQHYWLRFEFAPGRGQIHAHMIAIADVDKIMTIIEQATTNEERACLFQTWVTQSFNMTASFSMPETSITCNTDQHPSALRFSDTTYNPSYDAWMFQSKCQQHICNKYCLRKRKHFAHDENARSKKRRHCKVTNSIEVTPGKADTPGFPLQPFAEIYNDPRGFQTLRLPRTKNDNRLVQTSLYLARTWRANVDLQLILYNTSHDQVCPADFSGVIDYIVSYICKGSESLVQEKAHLRTAVLNIDTLTGDQKDVKRAARHILNVAAKQRSISKQEALCQLSGLPLFKCSETFYPISISGFYRLTTDKRAKRTPLAQYAITDTPMTLHQWVQSTITSKTNSIPHYTGGRMDPTIPVTASYARSMLIIHTKWSNQPWFARYSDSQLIAAFQQRLQDGHFPPVVTIPYFRLAKALTGNLLRYSEPTSSTEVADSTHARQNYPEIAELVDMAGMIPTANDMPDTYYGYTFNTGLAFDWSAQKYTPPISTVGTSFWLHDQIQSHRKQHRPAVITEPLKTNGSKFHIHDCHQDQKNILAVILQHLKRWIHHKLHNNTSPYPPLELTIAGEAGSGKSTLINTITAVIKRIFQDDKSVLICGPTGSAAFNAGGVTCHRLFSIPHNMQTTKHNADTVKRLHLAFNTAVALIVDERSMLTAANLGFMENTAAQYAHLAKNPNQPWGGIPIVILVGDDYQLPPIGKGAFFSIPLHATDHTMRPEDYASNQFEHHGLSLFKRIGKHVMFLSASQRVQQHDNRLRRLLSHSRGVNHSDTLDHHDLEVINSLHLQNSDMTYSSSDIANIKRNGMCIYAKKDPRNQHNAQMLHTLSTQTCMPVAIIKCKTFRNGALITNNNHFDPDRTPTSTTICRGAKIQLTGYNAMPEWGLYHGSIGVVIDIHFKPNESPNQGHMPQYVVCDFPQYQGPPFDKDHPKYVPIAPIKDFQCQRKCGCCRQYLPLTLAYGKTIHTFQGQSVGPVNANQTPNAIPYIVVDPGERDFEGKNPGLFYTLISRVTTLGDTQQGLQPAIYFTGPNIHKQRLQYLSLKPCGSGPYVKAQRRKQWVDYLTSNTVRHIPSLTQQHSLFKWAQTYRLNQTQLHQLFRHDS